MNTILGISLYRCPYLKEQKCYVFLIMAYFYSSTELKKSTEQVLTAREGEWRRRWGHEKEGEMTQTM
jgi:hypothetical protein